MPKDLWLICPVYFSKTPGFLKPLMSDLIWDIETEQKEIYLTFDDGPCPGVTDVLLDTLKDHNAKATFFCVGANVRKHPELFQRILDEDHAVGNHTLSHEKGWDTSQYAYLKSVLECDRLMGSKLFRPPHGRISRNQVSALKRRFHLIMWDVLSGDFDPQKEADDCVDVVIKNARPGSIVVFHDSEKCGNKMLESLPRVLQHFRKEGFEFPVIAADDLRPLEKT